MRNNRIITKWWGCLGAAVLLTVLYPSSALAGAMKLEAQLVWGTDTRIEGPTDRKPVEPDVQKKLSELPLKYSHYYEINRKQFEVKESDGSKVELSQKCQVTVKSLKDSKVEVVLYGKGKEVVKRTQDLPKGEMIVLAGNAPNATAWLVTLKRVE